MKFATFVSLFTFSVIVVSCKKESTQAPPEKNYQKVGVSKLTILNYRATKSDGSNWDASAQGTFPDVYFEVTKSGTTTSFYTLDPVNRKENLRTVDLPSSWSGSSGAPFYVLTDLSQIVDIDLYDYESLSEDEFMGSATFNFNNYTTGSSKYPPSITITNGSTKIMLDLVWIE